MYQRQAQGLASLGRGPDTELVHMTPREVGALDTLAKRNGLSGLPTNPQTGLPEAGIFDSILPMLVGAGAAAAAPFTGGGTLAAFLASPLAMGGTAALGAGIASGFDAAEMAKWGLGIYGGANLAGSLGAAGSAAPAQAEAATAATQEAARQKALAGAQAGVAEAGKTGAVQTKDQILKELIAKEAAKKTVPPQALLKPVGGGRGGSVWQQLNKQAAEEAARQAAQQQTALGAAQSNLATIPTTPITSPYAGLSPAEAGQLYRQTTATGTLGNTLPSSPMFGETAMQAGTDQLKAMGRGITTSSGRQALFGSGIGKDRVAGTLGKAPFITGLGSVAADQYIQSRDAEPFEFTKDEFNPFYPEGGFMPPPRTSIDPFAGDPVGAGFSEERLFFDPTPFTSPGYIPARAGGLVSLHEGGNVPTSSSFITELSQPSDSNRWTGGTLEEYKDWYNKKNPIQTMEMKNFAEMYEKAGGAEGTPATATSGSAFDSQMAQVARDKRAGIFGNNRGLLPTTPSSGMLPTTPSSGSGPISSNSGIKNFLEQLLSGAAQNNTGSPQFLGGVNQLGSIQTQSKNQGGLLRGPGDGMSDDIMLPITGSRDIAAVSPDEFVVPADVVSGLGNGSTSAGAKQLYGMMDRVRDTRTGKTAQPRAIDAGKMMPA